MAVLATTVRPRVARAKVPLHGFIVLIGPPGTGKTTLARGLATRVAESLPSVGAWRFLQVEPHALVSAGLGGSQKKVRRLLGETIAEYASAGPLVVFLDEVETLAADRYQVSLEANPLDVLRATDAVLAGLDDLAERFSNLLVIATSNFAGAVDAALLSRADLIETIAPPDRDGVERILRDTLQELARSWPNVANVTSASAFGEVIEVAVGLDGASSGKPSSQPARRTRTPLLTPGSFGLRRCGRRSSRRGLRLGRWLGHQPHPRSPCLSRHAGADCVGNMGSNRGRGRATRRPRPGDADRGRGHRRRLDRRRGVAVDAADHLGGRSPASRLLRLRGGRNSGRGHQRGCALLVADRR